MSLRRCAEKSRLMLIIIIIAIREIEILTVSIAAITRVGDI